MGLEDILTRILGEAEEEARKIRARGEAEAGKVLREAEAEAEALRRDLVAKGEQDLRREMSKRISKKRLEEKRNVLGLKKELLDTLFRDLPRRLQDRPAEEYARFLAGLVGDDLAGRPATLEVGEEDRRKFGTDISIRVGKRLKERFPRWEIAVGEGAPPFSRGVRVRTREMVHNLTLDTLVAEARERMEVEVAKTLFAKRQ